MCQCLLAVFVRGTAALKFIMVMNITTIALDCGLTYCLWECSLLEEAAEGPAAKRRKVYESEPGM